MTLVAAAGALAYLYTASGSTPNDFRAPVRMSLALRLAGFALVACAFVWIDAERGRDALRSLWRRAAAHPLVSLAAIAIGLYLLCDLTTPRIRFGIGAEGGGYGHDGLIYGSMAEHFSWFTGEANAPYAYRPLVPMIVHYMGIGTFHGFGLVNAVSWLACCGVFYALLRHYGACRSAALLGVFALGTVKAGLKFWIYYPILTDSFGFLLVLLALYATVARHTAVYLIVACAGMFCRESLVPMVAFHWIFGMRTATNHKQRLARSALEILPTAAFVASRAFPVFEPTGQFAGLDPVAYLGFWFVRLYGSSHRLAAVVAAYGNALGPLIVLAAVRWRTLARFLREHPEWILYTVAAFAMSTFGGHDIERSVLLFVPFLLIVLLRDVDPAQDPSIWLLGALLMAIAMETVLPWRPAEFFYFSRFAPLAGRINALQAMHIANAAMVAATLVGVVEYRTRAVRAG